MAGVTCVSVKPAVCARAKSLVAAEDSRYVPSAVACSKAVMASMLRPAATYAWPRFAQIRLRDAGRDSNSSAVLYASMASSGRLSAMKQMPRFMRAFAGLGLPSSSAARR